MKPGNLSSSTPRQASRTVSVEAVDVEQGAECEELWLGCEPRDRVGNRDRDVDDDLSMRGADGKLVVYSSGIVDVDVEEGRRLRRAFGR